MLSLNSRSWHIFSRTGIGLTDEDDRNNNNNNNNNNNTIIEEDHMACVVCMRLAYEYLYLTIINHGESKCSELLKAPFQHLINVDGEYNDYSVIGPTVYSFPVVRINLKQCKTVVKGGMKWLEEDPSVFMNSKQIF